LSYFSKFAFKTRGQVSTKHYQKKISPFVWGSPLFYIFGVAKVRSIFPTLATAYVLHKNDRLGVLFVTLAT